MRGGEFLEQARLFLKRILLIFPEFSTLRVVRDSQDSDGNIASDFSNFDQQVIASMPVDWAYINAASENKGFTRESLATICFRASFLLAPNQGARGITIEIAAGRPAGKSSDQVIIEICPELESPEFAKKLLGVCVEFWRPHHAYAGRYEVMRMLNQSVGDVRIGWLTYLADANARDALPNDILTMQLFSGILIQANELPSYQSDAYDIESMQKILRALGACGYLKNPQKKSKPT